MSDKIVERWQPKMGDRVKTVVGTCYAPQYAYGTVDVEIDEEHGNKLYHVNWDGGGYDYLYDFELEPA